MKKLRLVNLSPNERQKCNTQNGAWFCHVDFNGVLYMGKPPFFLESIYLALCHMNYSEKHAYALLHVIININRN